MHKSVAGSVAGRLKTTLQNGFILFYTVLLEIKQNPSLSVFLIFNWRKLEKIGSNDNTFG